jgi:hypothetical protein
VIACCVVKERAIAQNYRYNLTATLNSKLRGKKQLIHLIMRSDVKQDNHFSIRLRILFN